MNTVNNRNFLFDYAWHWTCAIYLLQRVYVLNSVLYSVCHKYTDSSLMPGIIDEKPLINSHEDKSKLFIAFLLLGLYPWKNSDEQ